MNAGVWFRRVRFVIKSPDLRLSSPPSGRKSTYLAVQIPQATSIVRVGNQTLEILGVRGGLNESAIHVACGYAGPAYGVPDDATIAAIQTVARSEALLLDPVYEGKAMAGLIDLVRRREFAQHQKVLYLHLGGTPAMHAYEDVLAS